MNFLLSTEVWKVIAGIAIFLMGMKFLEESLNRLSGRSFQQLSEIEFSTLVDFNRGTYTSLKSMVFSIKDYLLLAEQSAHFDELPGFLR
jgi:hypothetical protein